ncbi:hypothetical protein [Arthrobacter sp. DR-2P]|uniref:hypothetical protein n=1 Tax=unclassified Arthrobacter TaxID=235627 RepID=UPI00359FB5FD
MAPQGGLILAEDGEGRLAPRGRHRPGHVLPAGPERIQRLGVLRPGFTDGRKAIRPGGGARVACAWTRGTYDDGLAAFHSCRRFQNAQNRRSGCCPWRAAATPLCGLVPCGLAPGRS